MERDRDGGERMGEVREVGPADSGGERGGGPVNVAALGRGLGGEPGLDDLAGAGDEEEDEEDEEDKPKFGELRPSGGDGSMSGEEKNHQNVNDFSSTSSIM